MLLTGLTIMTAGLAWLIRVPVDGTYVVDLLPSMILLGVGAGWRCCQGSTWVSSPVWRWWRQASC
jgi:hypothetical protein